MPFSIVVGKIKQIPADAIVVPVLKNPFTNDTKAASVTNQTNPLARHVIQTTNTSRIKDVYLQYMEALNATKEKNCKSIALSLITYWFTKSSKQKSLEVTISAISDFLSQNDMDIMLWYRYIRKYCDV